MVRQTPEDGGRTNAARRHQTNPADLLFHGSLNSFVVLRHQSLYLYMFRRRLPRQHLTLWECKWGSCMPVSVCVCVSNVDLHVPGFLALCGRPVERRPYVPRFALPRVCMLVFEHVCLGARACVCEFPEECDITQHGRLWGVLLLLPATPLLESILHTHTIVPTEVTPRLAKFRPPFCTSGPARCPLTHPARPTSKL